MDSSIDIEKFNNGDDGTYRLIHAKYYQLIFTFIKEQVNDEAKTLQMATDIFNLLNTRPVKFKNEEAIKQWLTKAANNMCMSEVFYDKKKPG